MVQHRGARAPCHPQMRQECIFRRAQRCHRLVFISKSLLNADESTQKVFEGTLCQKHDEEVKQRSICAVPWAHHFGRKQATGSCVAGHCHQSHSLSEQIGFAILLKEKMARRNVRRGSLALRVVHHFNAKNIITQFLAKTAQAPPTADRPTFPH